MENKLIELLRKILRRVVLPLRKRREQFLSKFRFSIAFRISISYFKLLLIHGILFMILFCLLYMFSEKSSYVHMADKITASIKENNYSIQDNMYSSEGLLFQLYDKDNKQVLYQDTDFKSAMNKKYFYGIYFNQGGGNEIFILTDVKSLSGNSANYQLKFFYNMTGSYKKMLALLWKLIILYLLMVYIILRKGKKADIKIFEPVRIMSATANRLTANNLHSERLSVEGTKNELKDLAAVINAMLDRIETSYESQKQFVSDASHELRTPIAVIQGYINMLNRWGTKDEAVLQESVEAIQNEARSMQDLVEKLLFLSRHDKKTLKLTKKRFNMRHVVEDMVKETKLVAPNRVINSPILEDVIVYGDKQSLKQAIRIFIDNAVKYTKDGDQITITCQKQGEECIITIQDTGIGMTKKDMDHIFDRFYRSDYVRNQNISGHGLGLSLAKLIILAHVGKIKVRSQFGKGTSFIITLTNRR